MHMEYIYIWESISTIHIFDTKYGLKYLSLKKHSHNIDYMFMCMCVYLLLLLYINFNILHLLKTYFYLSIYTLFSPQLCIICMSKLFFLSFFHVPLIIFLQMVMMRINTVTFQKQYRTSIYDIQTTYGIYAFLLLLLLS